MPIPDYQTIMLPLLQLISDNQEHNLKDLIEMLSKDFQLTEEERAELLPSGQSFVFSNRVGWARTYLKKAGLLSSPKRGCLQITDRGHLVLKRKPSKIDLHLLKEFPEFIEFQNLKKEDETTLAKEENNIESISRQTPQELIDSAYQSIRASLAQELLERIKGLTPIFFEKLVLDLLLKMGYGGSIKDAGKSTKLTNDEGIDGIIKEDKLGLDFIYIQAKRWTDTSVGRPDIQSFVGALDGQRASKGIFITTSTFANTAREYVKTISKKVILIDGQELSEYMIDYGLGVSTIQTFEIKRIDSDYFDE
ncbi:restriction system protein [Chitinophaga sp. W2I13]|uniref:restriction endonuclease n=1 Tax=Chitinophaga sp. W2I13 TaxID=3373923 RepID=UPI003D25EF73